MTNFLRVSFFEDESVPGFLSRMAWANGRESLQGFLQDLGFDPLAVSRGEDEENTRLAAKLGLPLDAILARTVRVNANKTMDFAGGRFTRFELSRSTFRVCPHCMLEDDGRTDRMPGTRRYARSAWMLSSVISCDRHGTRILELDVERDWGCPDFTSAVHLADADIRLAALEMTAGLPTDFETFVRDRLRGLRDHGTILDGACLSSAIDMCRLFGMASHYGREFRFRGIDDAQLARATNQGYIALRSGEPALFALLDRLSAGGQADMRSGGNGIYGTLYKSLRRTDRGEEYEPAREVIRQHAIRSFSLPPSAKIFGDVENASWVGVADIARSSGLASETVRGLLRRDKSTDASGHNEHAFLSSAEGEVLVTKLRDTIELPEASKLLGWTIFECRRLADEGVLVPVLERATKGKGTRARYSRQSVLDLQRKLARPGVEASGLATVSKAFSTYAGYSGDILRILFGGDLKQIVSGSGTLLDSTLIDLDELREALFPGCLDADGVCSLLGVSRRSLPLLIKAGALESLTEPRQIFSRETVEAFDRSYVTAVAIGKELYMHPKTVSAYLRKMDVALAFPQDEVGCLIIHRRDMERL